MSTMTNFTSDLSTEAQVSAPSGVIIYHQRAAHSWAFHWCPDRSHAINVMLFFRSQVYNVKEIPYSSSRAWSSHYPSATLGGVPISTASLTAPLETPKASSAT